MLRRPLVLAACVFAMAGLFVSGGSTREAVAAGTLCGFPGTDGPVVLSGVVNTYYPPAASAAAGATSITLGASRGAATAITAGDLLLVIQMQDAAIDSTNTASYGGTTAGSTALNATGLYEYVVATNSVPTAGGVLNLGATGAGAGLNNSYTEAAATAGQGQRTFQVIRVPQYSAATLTNTLTAAPWNGTTGGVLALDVAGATNLGGATVSVSQMGFRAGLGRQFTGGAGGTGTDFRNLSSLPFHGAKAEGIAGSPAQMFDSRTSAAVAAGVEGYPNGSTARGAPGNAGGGGTDPNPTANDQNTGGGGGGNGGSGGMGGNSWNTNLAVGGGGGAAFTPATGRVVLGGGGGAGSRNNSPGIANASSGGNGGGVVLLRTGSVSGTGTISADGGVGVTPDNDGGGGGGAGGSVVIVAQAGGLVGLSVQARGGRGTDAWPTNAGGAPSFHGPGGGGGGGAVFTSSAPTSVNVAGGATGTTTTLASNYGAALGSPGVAGLATAGLVTGASAGSACVPALTVTKSTSTPTVVNTPAGTTATYTIRVTNQAGLAPATAMVISDALPAGFTYASNVAVTTSGAATRTSVSDPTVGSATPAWGVFTIPGGGSVNISFVANVAATVPPATYQNPATATYTDPARSVANGTARSSYDPSSSTAEDVTVVNSADIGVVKTVNNSSPVIGQNVVFTITTTNHGPSDATGVQVTDQLPAGVTFVSATASGTTTYNAVSGVWNIGPLTNGSSAALQITVTATGTGRIVNTARKTAENQFDPNSVNDAASGEIDAQSVPGAPDTGGAPVGPGAPAVPVGQLLLAAWLAGLASLVWALGLMAGGRERRHRLLVGALSVYLIAGTVLPLSDRQLDKPGAISSGLRAGIADRQLFGKEISQAVPAPRPATTTHAAAGPILPARLRIPSLGIDTNVEGVGVTRNGAMDVPGNLWNAGWLDTGPRPGAPGQAILDGHKNSTHGPGLFKSLGQLRAGDRIYVSDAAGGELTFEVVQLKAYPLSTFSRTDVFGPATMPELNLITCVGGYSAQTHTYDHRLVVFTRLLAA